MRDTGVNRVGFNNLEWGPIGESLCPLILNEGKRDNTVAGVCEGASVFDDDPLEAVVVLPIICYDVDGGGENVKAGVIRAIAVVGPCEGLAGWAGEKSINQGECDTISDLTA